MIEIKFAPVRQHAQSRSGVTPREAEVLALLHLSNREIAGLLYIAVETVKAHLKSAFVKLGVENRTQAALAWQQMNAPAWRETRAA